MRAREFIFEQGELPNQSDDDQDVDKMNPVIVSVLSMVRQELKDARERFGESYPSTVPLDKILEKIRNAGLPNYSEEDLLDDLQDTASTPEMRDLVDNVTPDAVEFNIDGKKDLGAQTSAGTPSKPDQDQAAATVSSMAKSAAAKSLK